MNVFVTVGTTKFDDLIRNVDIIAGKTKKYSFIYQISDGDYHPQNGSFFSYNNDIERVYNASDIVITHAGAGSIYRLLELEKKILVVPNFSRVDKHQVDISSYMEENKHCLVAWELNQIEKKLNQMVSFSPVKFTKTPFFKFDEIVSFIKGQR